MGGDVDMNNHFLTGLPSPVAPSDAVNYHSLVAMFLNAEIVAQATVRIAGGTTGSFSGYVSMRKVALYGTDVIFEVSGSVSIQAGAGTIENITVTLPEVFKYGSDWSDLGEYRELRATYNGHSYIMGPTTTTTGILVYTAWNIGQQQENDSVAISGHIKVGVNA